MELTSEHWEILRQGIEGNHQGYDEWHGVNPPLKCHGQGVFVDRLNAFGFWPRESWDLLVRRGQIIKTLLKVGYFEEKAPANSTGFFYHVTAEGYAAYDAYVAQMKNAMDAINKAMWGE